MNKAEEYIAECGEYTDTFGREKIIKNWEEKGQVAENVVGDFIKRVGEVKGRTILDIGFGNGEFAVAFAKAGAIVSGLEVNHFLAEIAEEKLKAAGLTADLRVYDGERFPFGNAVFDYLFSVSVLEHVSDDEKFITEAFKALKYGGKFYLAFPNRWRPKEPHCGMYFVSYLPRPIGRFVAKLFGHNTYDELNLHPTSYWRMRRLARRHRLKIKNETYSPSKKKRLFKEALWKLGMHHSAILGTVMVILEKRAS
jgi:ubiquinone/menaquinone biosynthesis C-methylase UbiE